MSRFRYTIELCPPLNPANTEVYYEKFKHLLRYTNSFSISSHASSDGLISGFYRSYNLAKFLLEQEPTLSLLIHVTCHDLNRVNIEARLSLLKSLGIKRILVVSGEQYSTANVKHPDLLFENSEKLLRHIKELHYSDWFPLIAMAAYPVVGDCESSQALNKMNCQALKRKSMDGTVGAIYTQCLFANHNFHQFYQDIRGLLPSIKVIPSIALFDCLQALNKSSKLTKVQPDPALIDRLECNNEKQQSGGGEGASKQLCLSYLKHVCEKLREASKLETLEINVCPFGLFNFATELIENLREDVY